MKKIYFVLILLLSTGGIAQNHFEYLFHVGDTTREGTLLYDSNTNKAIYIDKLGTTIERSKKKPLGTLVVGITDGKNRFFFKEPNNKTIFTYTLLKIPYIITDQIDNIEWNLSNESKNIQGYKCLKATTKFRGRNWEVWYSPEIPIKYGPWKFTDLPGLVFEAIDESKRFGFQLTKVKTSDEFQNLNIDLSKHYKVDMKEFDLLLEDALTFKSLSKSRYYTITQKEPYKRNGIELIYEWEEEK